MAAKHLMTKTMLRPLVKLTLLMLFCGAAHPQEWHSQPLSEVDWHYMETQHDAINDLARSHFGRSLNGEKINDIAILQRLLDDSVVGREQVSLLQAMGLILGELLKREKGLTWVAYTDQYGRSRSLQVPGIDREFIFPATRISRLVEVGAKVDVGAIYRELEQAVTDIRNKPPF